MQQGNVVFAGIRRFVLTCAVVVFALFLCHPEQMRGQGIITGGISGTIVDQNGALIPGATITAKNDATGASLVGKANGEGTFLISDVPVGTYTVAIAADGSGGKRNLGRQADVESGCNFSDRRSHGRRGATAEH